jgi:hypothetical protein
LYCYLFGFRNIVGDEDIVEDGASLNLPQIETNDAGLVVFANGGIGGVLGVIDFWVDPDTLRLSKKVL